MGNKKRLIDANVLLTLFCNDCGMRDENYSNSCEKDCDIYDTIMDCPTAEAQPIRHGKWIIDYAEGTKIYHAHCSECNKEPDNNIGGDYYIDKLSDFCPNCGSYNRMGGDSE